MGIVKFGLPFEQSEFLRKQMCLNTFVEGGAYKGNTASAMAKYFERVFTIEKSDSMYEIAKNNIHESNITLLKGDTREHLGKIIGKNDNILFWLDAHWSGGLTYGEKDECPLLEELAIIFSFEKNMVILIDDARLFLAPPPLPHNSEVWPTITDIVKITPDDWCIIEFEDVLYIYPIYIKKEFTSFFQEITTRKWKEAGNMVKGSVLESIKMFIKCFLKGKFK